MRVSRAAGASPRRVYNFRGEAEPRREADRSDFFATDYTLVNAQSLPASMSTLTSIDDLRFGTAVPQTVVAEEPLTDHALLEATRTGDEAAFAEIVSRYRNQITSYIYRMLNDYDGAVDMAQETFVRVYQAAERYQTNYAFSTYIYRIATNLAISELRKAQTPSAGFVDGIFPADRRRRSARV